MASIVGKRINGGTYYYLVESARVDGRPRIVAQRYLGSAETVAAAVSGGLGTPAAATPRPFGAIAATWSTLCRLGVADAVNEAVGERPTSRGDSLGDLLALAVLHRVTGADAGEQDEWWAGGAARRIVRRGPDPAALRPRARWRAWDRLTPARLRRLEVILVDRLAEEFGVGGPALAVDLPAAHTVTGGAGAGPDGGSLLVGIGMVVSQDGMIPLTVRPYPALAAEGSDREVALGELADRHRELAGTAGRAADQGTLPAAGLTVVLEPGRADRIAVLDGRGLPVVAALQPSELTALAPDTRGDYRDVDPVRFPGVRAWDTGSVVAGRRRRVIAVRSATLREAQARSFAEAVTTAIRRLDELDTALRHGMVRHTRDRLLAEITAITRARGVDRVLTATLSGPDAEPMRLHRRIDEAAWTRLHHEVFGSQLLVTDRLDWPVAEVLTAYRARYYLDSTLRLVGDTVRAAPWPGFRWSERRIAVHTLIGTLATTVVHLMRLEASRIGLDFSVAELLDCLGGVEEIALRYSSTGGRPRTLRLLAERTPTQQRLFDRFELHRYAPAGADHTPPR